MVRWDCEAWEELSKISATTLTRFELTLVCQPAKLVHVLPHLLVAEILLGGNIRGRDTSSLCSSLRVQPEFHSWRVTETSDGGPRSGKVESGAFYHVKPFGSRRKGGLQYY